MRIVGYSDVWSVAPGERIQFMVSTVHASFDASIVRLYHGDPKPGGPGLKVVPVETTVDGTYDGHERPYPLGSLGIVEHAPDLDPDGPFTVSAWIYPTTPANGFQGLVTKRSESADLGWGLFLDPAGAVAVRLDTELVSTDVPVAPSAWIFVSAAFDGTRVRLEQRPLRCFPGGPADVAVEREVPAGASPTLEPVRLGAGFNGKLESPRLDAGARPIASWDFSLEMGSDRIRDRSENAHHGRLVNMPMRAITGHNWTGSEIDWRNAPDEYGAIFFHDDDLEDAGWQPSFELHVPEALASGVYAARLRAGKDEDWVPFFVRPPRGESRSSIAFLAPTLSYLAYANEHAAEGNPVAVTDFELSDYYQPEDRLAIDVPLLGLYDKHRDGVGCCYSSRLRPIVNMRPQYHLPLIRSAHQFPADLHLVDWLDEKGFAVDTVTDEDLHDEGLELLRRYRVVITGSHPEYWTSRMLESLARYLEDGGRVVYLGGNGFYWVTSIDPERPHAIEVRRGRRGTGTWRGAPGEDFHSTTGEPGGLWRDRGLPPQRLVGVGMAAQGFDRALPFERAAGADDPRAAWIFAGVPERVIGEHGLTMDGAVGLEFDRLDHALGTPPHALLLASARGFSDSYQHVVEEVASSDSRQGGTVSPFVRADMVFFELPAGGAVFSASSIAWCGSLSYNGYDNAVSRITENVLRRFADPEPFGAAPPREGGSPR